jgi:hypothetical protein
MPNLFPLLSPLILLRSRHIRGFRQKMLAIVVGKLMVSCVSEAPLTEPEGGMHAFAVTYAEAVGEGNPGPLYQTISDANHARLSGALVELRQMEGLLQGLQESEREVYREQAGLVFAASLAGPYDLLAHLVSRAQLPVGERVIRGMAVATTVWLMALSRKMIRTEIRVRRRSASSITWGSCNLTFPGDVRAPPIFRAYRLRRRRQVQFFKCLVPRPRRRRRRWTAN